MIKYKEYHFSSGVVIECRNMSAQEKKEAQAKYGKIVKIVNRG